MSNLTVIGIAGRARAGKDTVASILQSRYGFFRVAQGDGIRAVFANLNGQSWELLKEVEEAGLTSRDPLQKLGGECKEDIGRLELWTDLTLAGISYVARQHPKPRTRIVIPGMRYPVERDRFKAQIEAWGGTFEVWMIQRESAGLTGRQADHPSETSASLVEADVVIDNDSDIEMLEATVAWLADRVLRKLKEAA